MCQVPLPVGSCSRTDRLDEVLKSLGFDDIVEVGLGASRADSVWLGWERNFGRV